MTHSVCGRVLLDAGAEVGVLYTETPEGRNRYPSSQWIADTAWRCKGGKLSLHVCGSKARTRLLDHNSGLAHDFNRLQINGSVSETELTIASRIYAIKGIITQDSLANRDLRTCSIANHAILVDGSGGRGLLSSQWVRPVTPKMVGFAGGLGPHNLREELPKIMAVATGDWWTDMETGVRTDDWFDVDKALEAVRIFNEIVKG